MKFNCDKHGEVEATPNKNGDVWCPDCFRELIHSEEGRAKLSQVLVDEFLKPKLPPIKAYPVISEKPRGFPPVALAEDVAGIEPPYQETYIRRIRVEDDE